MPVNEYDILVDAGRPPRYAEDCLDMPAISLYPQAEQGGIHTQNDPNNPFQRESITQRINRFDVRCDHKDIIHGVDSPDNDFFCSLIVYEFQFHPNHFVDRIKEAHAQIEFSSMHKDEQGPEVLKVYPDKKLYGEGTNQSRQVVNSAGMNITGGVGIGMGGELSHGTTTNMEMLHYATVRGSADLTCPYGPKNAVSWHLLENPKANMGVVPHLRCAVLLKRDHTAPFRADLTLTTKVNTTSKFEWSFAKFPADDPVLYNPNKKPTNRLRTYDIDNLNSMDLASLSEVGFRTFAPK